MATNGSHKLDNATLSDRELLHLIADIASQDSRGLVLASDVAEALHFNGSDRRTAATRMSWMAQLGYLERIDPKTLGLTSRQSPRYIMTDEGRALMGGKLNVAVQKVLDKADPGTGLLIIREIGERNYVRGSQTTANGIRRQWQHTAAKRGR